MPGHDPDSPTAQSGEPLDAPFVSGVGISSLSGVSPGAFGISPVLFDPATSTPLEPENAESVEDAIPTPARWAMQSRMHSNHRPSSDDPGVIYCSLGAGDSSLFVFSDGPDHCMFGRLVGHSPDGCVYVLVARATVFEFDQLNEGEVALEDAFAAAKDISLCQVFKNEAGPSNVVLVQHYRKGNDVPQEYLPPSPFLHFSAD